MIPDSGVKFLQEVATEYYPKTRFPFLNAWKSMDNERIWQHFVGQVAVVGSAASYDRIVASPTAQTDLAYENLLSLDLPTRRRKIHKVLRECGVRYVARDIEKCLKTKAVIKNLHFLSHFQGGPRAYLKYIASIREDDAKIEQVKHDMFYIKNKGARDMLNDLGMISDSIAFDIRIINILTLLGTTVPEDLHADSHFYKELEKEMIEKVCKPLEIKAVHLDKILFQYYNDIAYRLKEE